MSPRKSGPRRMEGQPPRQEIRRRNGARRSVRGEKCFSTIVTRKELHLLNNSSNGCENKENRSPKANPGFVKTMCKFYSDVFSVSPGRRIPQRSSSFSSPKPGKAGSRPSNLVIHRSRSFHHQQEEDTAEEIENAGNQLEENLGNRMDTMDIENNPPQHSPTWQSVKSQDSGFSDSGESHGDQTSPQQHVNLYNVQQESVDSLENTLGTISSLQTGLRMKLEDEPRSLHRRAEAARTVFRSDCSSTSKLIHFINCRNKERMLQSRRRSASGDGGHPVEDSPQTPMSSENKNFDRNVEFEMLRVEPGPLFSTPVRSSFRRRPRTMIGIEEAHTPVHSEAPPPRSSSSVQQYQQPRRPLAGPKQLEPLEQLPNAFRGVRKETSSSSSDMTTHTIIEHEDTQTEHAEELTVNLSVEPGKEVVPADPVSMWWRDLLVITDSECMTYLQSKPVRSDSTRCSVSEAASKQVLKRLSSKQSLVKFNIKEILQASKEIEETIKIFTREFPNQKLAEMNRTVMELISKIQDYVYDYNLNQTRNLSLETVSVSDLPGLRSRDDAEVIPEIDGMYEILLLQQKIVLQVVDRLKLCSHRSQYTPQKPVQDMRRVLVHLEHAFSKLCDLSLRKEVKLVVETLSSSLENNEYLMVECLNTLIELGNQQSSQLYTIIAQMKTIETLVNVSQSSSSVKEIKLLALRSISSVCCTVQCIRNLEKSGGIEMITRFLVSGSSLEVRVEAAGVLAQITSPWISDNHQVQGLKENLSNLVHQLSTLARLQCGEDSFLLVSAALANLTFMEPGCMEMMLKHSTSRILTSRLESMSEVSIFARDQVTTVIANLAGTSGGRERILSEKGIEFLVSQMKVEVESAETSAESAAVERVLKKSAIALCRLCLGETECRILEGNGALHRIVQLCQQPYTRNYSDSVLVACLALLRRVSAHLHMDLQENLVQENLVESFRELSHQHESYV